MEIIELLNNSNKIFGNLAITCLAINVLLCLFFFKKLGTPFRRFCYFLIWNLLIEISARVFAYYEVNNLPLLHLYTLGEFILLSYFYQSLIEKPVFFQKKYWYFVFIGALLIIVNSLFFQNIYGFNTIAKTFVQIIIISFAVLFFYHLTEKQSLSHPVKKSLRLVNSAIIVYYSGSFFIFMCSQISFSHSDLYKVFWVFNAILNLIFQMLVLWGISKLVFRKTSLSS